MAYTTQAKIEGSIANPAQYCPEDKSYVDWIADQIESAQDEIDGRLEGLYSVPFSDPVPGLVKTIARYFACSLVMNPGFVGEVPADSKVVDTFYSRGDALLRRIEKGEIKLDASGSEIESGAPQSSTIDTARAISRTTYDSEGNVLDEGTLEGL